MVRPFPRARYRVGAPHGAPALAAPALDRRLPHGADWNRKHHLPRAHLASGADPAALTRDTQLTGVKTGSRLARQLATRPALHPGQQHLMTALHLTLASDPLAPARRTFGQTVQLPELFLHREGRAPAAREAIRVDGDTVKSGAWLAQAHTEHRSGQLPEAHAHLVAALFEEDWTLPIPHRLGGRPVRAWSRRSVRHLDRLVGAADRGPRGAKPDSCGACAVISRSNRRTRDPLDRDRSPPRPQRNPTRPWQLRP